MNSPYGSTMGGATQGGMMGGPYGAAIGAGLGLGNYYLFEKPAYQRQVALAANTERLSPWTKMHGQLPEPVNPLGSAFGGASMGASMGQSFDRANQQNRMNNAYLNYLENYNQAGAAASPTSVGSGGTGYGMAPGAPVQPQPYLPYGGWYGMGR